MLVNSIALRIDEMVSEISDKSQVEKELYLIDKTKEFIEFQERISDAGICEKDLKYFFYIAKLNTVSYNGEAYNIKQLEDLDVLMYDIWASFEAFNNNIRKDPILNNPEEKNYLYSLFIDSMVDRFIRIEILKARSK